MRITKKNLILTISFVLFLVLNGYLIAVHEPWRDEIHAWLMAKYMSPFEMIAFSRHEGHPLLWHFILMPFAKAGAPVWTMHIISYIIVAVSAWLFLFRTKMHDVMKVVVLFTVPFLYTYSSIARNYCLILLLGMVICTLYDKRYEHPFLYSIFIALMVFTHAMAWGLVAGLTITFHIKEIATKLLGKSKLDRKHIGLIWAGLGVVAASTIFAVLTLFGKRNSGYFVVADDRTNNTILTMLGLLLISFLILLLTRGKIWKETVTLLTTYALIIYIYNNVFSGVLFQRQILISVFMLIFTLCALAENKDLRKEFKACIIALYVVSLFLGGNLLDTYYYIAQDINCNYSSGKEMADYINANLPDEEVILVDAGTFAQTMVPYTDKTLYDIRYEENIVDSLYCVDEGAEIVQHVYAIPEHEEYKGRYIVLYYEFNDLPFEKIYRTSDAITGEYFTLYYIPE